MGLEVGVGVRARARVRTCTSAAVALSRCSSGDVLPAFHVPHHTVRSLGPRRIRRLPDPPEPAEFEHYLQTGEYDASEPVALVPAFYAKRWRRFQGRLYADLTAWNAGDPPVGHLEGGAGNKYRFVEVVQTERGPVLLRSDGKVAFRSTGRNCPFDGWTVRGRATTTIVGGTVKYAANAAVTA